MDRDRCLLILDLDDTLIHARDKPLPDRSPDFRVDPYYVYKRPGFDSFLETAVKHFDLAVWTSSSPNYAQSIVAKLFGQPNFLKFVWTGDKCVWSFSPDDYNRVPIKDLRKVVRSRFAKSLDRILIIDDSPAKLRRNYGNLLQIKPFFGGLDDDELSRILKPLEKLRSEPNVRLVEKRDWRLW